MKKYFNKRGKTVNEYINENCYYVSKYNKILVHRKTKYQEYLIVEDYQGKSVFIDGILQSREQSERIYHEMLVHPLSINVSPLEKVLIIGGGEGAVLRELLKYRSIQEITQVDIDRKFVNDCKKYLYSYHQNSFESSKVKIEFADAFEYLSKCKSKFDVIILDLPALFDNSTNNLSNIAHKILYGDFFSNISRCLNDNGGIAGYIGDNFLPKEQILKLRDASLKCLPNFNLYMVHPLFLKMFIASKVRLENNYVTDFTSISDIISDIDSAIDKKIEGDLKYYCGHEQIVSFMLDKIFRKDFNN